MSTVLNDPEPKLLAGLQGLYLEGAWQDGEGKPLKVLDPSTERVIGTVGTASPGHHGLLRYTALRSVYHHFSPLSDCARDQ